jgi:hypothetical protein
VGAGFGGLGRCGVVALVQGPRPVGLGWWTVEQFGATVGPGGRRVEVDGEGWTRARRPRAAPGPPAGRLAGGPVLTVPSVAAERSASSRVSTVVTVPTPPGDLVGVGVICTLGVQADLLALLGGCGWVGASMAPERQSTGVQAPHRFPIVRIAAQKEVRRMSTWCRPAVAVPECLIPAADSLDLTGGLHAGHEQLGVALRLIRHTGAGKRHVVQPVEETRRHPRVRTGNALYEREAKARMPGVVHEALRHAGLMARATDLIIFGSYTGFVMPSLPAWLINTPGFRENTRRMPIARLGCAAGGAAINRAHDVCTAYPGGMC